jgi:RNA polymerase sigma-70 factor, ECF subfamily
MKLAEPALLDDPTWLLEAARSERAVAWGRLLERYTPYLTLMARIEIGRRLQGKVDPGDIVQDTFLEAHRQFSNFRGRSEKEFTAWLRTILAGILANTIRHYFGTRARDPRLEQDLNVSLNHSSCGFANQLSASCSTPSEIAVRREEAVLFAQGLQQLPETYREVIVLRHLEGLTFPHVAERMGKTVDSVEKLWLRAVAKLKESVSKLG